jgi:hypothetical protein
MGARSPESARLPDHCGCRTPLLLNRGPTWHMAAESLHPGLPRPSTELPGLYSSFASVPSTQPTGWRSLKAGEYRPNSRCHNRNGSSQWRDLSFSNRGSSARTQSQLSTCCSGQKTTLNCSPYSAGSTVTRSGSFTRKRSGMRSTMCSTAEEQVGSTCCHPRCIPASAPPWGRSSSTKSSESSTSRRPSRWTRLSPESQWISKLLSATTGQFPRKPTASCASVPRYSSRRTGTGPGSYELTGPGCTGVKEIRTENAVWLFMLVTTGVCRYTTGRIFQSIRCAFSLRSKPIRSWQRNLVR